jgi:hypothetical protein
MECGILEEITRNTASGFIEPVENLIFFRLIKNAQMQGVREPFTCRSGRQS